MMLPILKIAGYVITNFCSFCTIASQMKSFFYLMDIVDFIFFCLNLSLPLNISILFFQSRSSGCKIMYSYIFLLAVRAEFSLFFFLCNFFCCPSTVSWKLSNQCFVEMTLPVSQMLDDFVDVTKDEKQMMHLWNSFVRKQRFIYILLTFTLISFFSWLLSLCCFHLVWLFVPFSIFAVTSHDNSY